MVVQVAVEQTGFKLDSLYDYNVPCELTQKVFAGCRVTVPFGRSNKLRKGIIIKVTATEQNDALKPILRCVDEQPLFSEEMLKTAEYVKEHTFCTMYDALKFMLPKDAEKPSKIIKTARHIENPSVKLTPKQKKVWDFLSTNGEMPVKDLCEWIGVGMSVIKNMEKNQSIEILERTQEKGTIKSNAKANFTEIRLNENQQKCYNRLYSYVEDNRAGAALLYGVTGSGKTSVYMKLADAVLEKGKGVIIMVPEIALTSQAVSLFKRRYGDKVALFHSRLSDGERASEWRRVKRGEATIALGTRSAVFAPMDNIGLIVMDEEQEHTYKSESSPRFHARDVARFRAAYHNALFLMASATPCVSSFARAKNGQYELLTLNERYGDAVLPKVITVDMKKELAKGNTTVISTTLAEHLDNCLKNKKQAILLLNRRGYNTFVSCKNCGEVITCKHCSISMAYHKAGHRLMCHYCGESIPIPEKCPSCGGGVISMRGIGTQKAVDELKIMFPEARILRMDADTTTGKNSHSENLNSFAKGEYDFLVGTQMVAKGLDFPNVNLVGILCADQALYNNDFRACERAFSLLTQVVGRAGRSDGDGVAIIQTVNPENEIIQLAAEQDYIQFFNMEYSLRKMMQYPPFCDVCLMGFVSDSDANSKNASFEFFEIFTNVIKNEFPDVHVKILGPTPALIVKVGDKYRYRMIVKCKNTKRFRMAVAKSISIYEKSKVSSKVNLFVDVNPENLG